MIRSTTSAYSSSPVSKPPSSANVDRLVGQRGQQLVERDLELGGDVDDGQRGAVVVRLEPALGDLPERDGDQPVEPPPVLGHALLERDVGQPLDLLRDPPTSVTVGVSRSRITAHASCPISSSRAAAAEWVLFSVMTANATRSPTTAV